uniref:Usher syndrome 2A (autosomal recessive, mild) n=1 Tax=Electrophorus electricus TaxID=8005 RepID=A0A4W4GYM7_ELEEL
MLPCPENKQGKPLFQVILSSIPDHSLVAPQGSFPKLENIGAHKPVSVMPPGATCGVPKRSAFCWPAQIPEDLLTCSQRFCIQDCPYRSSTPHYTDLLAARLGGCPAGDSQDLHPGAAGGSTSFAFRNQSSCLASFSSLTLGPDGSFTLTLWVKLEEAAVMTVFEKSTMDRLVFLLRVSEAEVQLHYGVQDGHTVSITMSTAGRMTVGRWAHLALQVGNALTAWLLLLAGCQQAIRPASASERECNGLPIGPSYLEIRGAVCGRTDLYFPHLHVCADHREIEEVYSGRLPRLYAQIECRCPPSHPRVHPLVERYCIPNGASDTTDDRVLRLNLDAHPLHYINDGDMGTAWVSSVLSTQEELDQGVTVTIDLQNGEYQVFYVILQLRSAPAEAVQIQRKSSRTAEWSDWQYLASDCSILGMVSNGPLDRPDSVNCLRFPSNVPYSRGNVTFSVLTPEPNLRPGYNDFYNSAALQDFVRATHVRIHLRGQYHTRNATVPLGHRYYAVDEITISGRCDCHGHADACDTSVSPYRCACLLESHTQGAHCERCKPLFNDKPFRAGEPAHANHCRPCQCHGHASSCHYDASVDPRPLNHLRGGGGVCDRCTHNTAGRNCEQCKSLFYRELGASLWDEDVCKPCECSSAGTVNGSLECDQIGGQCKCKPRVWGRRCDVCPHGFYGLQGALADGCRACGCHAAGTMKPDVTCHKDSGQCPCKANVMGLSCDRCNYGFKFLNHTNPDGCEPCGCHPDGSLHQFCDRVSGQCECRAGIRGLLCDVCGPGSYGPAPGGLCLPCNCSLAGSVAGSTCHPVTGECMCQLHVTGQRCNLCRAGYHSLGGGGELHCLPCVCNAWGVAEGSVCDRTTGYCHCKSGVEGPRCEQCSPHMYNLSSGNATHACQPCLCDPSGTAVGTVCDPDSGQCVCQPTRHGPDCSTCKPGNFRSKEGSCVACDCHPAGAAGPACAADTGQCTCSHASLTGRRCNRCRDLYFGFDPAVGRCDPCDCNLAGALNGSCLPETGQCVCKPFVTGEKCERCVEGASHMDPNNTLGCSKEPRQQPPPQGTALSARVIALSWRAPDSPNSDALTYTLLRDSEPIHTCCDTFLPVAGLMLFTDEGLTPYTLYTYQLVTSNVHGNTTSSNVTLRTLVATPDPTELRLRLVGQAGPRAASFAWSPSAPVELYALISVDEESGQEHTRYEGLATAVTVDGLQPFTRYTFHLQACTSGGCARGDTVSVLTAQAPPQGQAPPRVTMLGPAQLRVDWEPPALPNGIIIRYELFMQILNKSLENVTNPNLDQRVFLSSGWLNPQKSGSASENSLTPPESSVVVSDLEPFTTYRFRVIAVNMAGSISSEWMIGRTAEGVPEYMGPPQVSPLSSFSLLVRWKTPQEQDVRGRVTEYRVSLYQEQSSNPYTPPTVTQLLYSASAQERNYTVVGLKAHEEYSFIVAVCNAQGCVSSLPASGRTLPSGQLRPLNTTSMGISWATPAKLNGPLPVYYVERTDVSFSDTQGMVIRGRRFSGTGYFRFPSSTLPANTDFTGLQLSFRTREADGLILCALSPGAQEEYVALQLYGGRPYFLFDAQASAVAVELSGDGGRKYNDDQWHHVVAARTQAVGTIIVDDQYSGSARTGSTIIGQNTGVFLGGLPENFTLHRQDTARLVRQGFVGCVRDMLIQTASSPVALWEPLDWDSALEEHETYGGWEGCPAQSEHGAYFLGHGFLKLEPEVFIGGEDFEISFEFRTDQLNALLLFAYDSQGADYVLVSFLAAWVGLSYCDGRWNRATLLKRGALTAAGLNGAMEHRRGPLGGPLTVTSPLYLGGVPDGLRHPALRQHSLLQGFGGCIRDVRLVAQGPVVNLAAVCHGAVRVNLDGCLSADTSVNCRGNDSILVYAGRETSTLDLTLQPFTEYLYRVMASGEGGWTTGPWQRGRSLPQSVLPPSRVASVNGSSAEVRWEEPVGVRGVIERYVVKAHSRDRPSSPPISAAFPDTPPLTGTLNGLAPFSSYSITLTACTQAGCAESSAAALLTTPQEAPEEVLPPHAVASPHSLAVYWEHPQKPNGVLSHFILYENHTVIYQGSGTAFNLTGLGVYTSHRLLLSACTGAGCTNSSAVTFVTGQLAPAHMDAPVLTVLDARTIHVQWAAPLQANGRLQSYSLYRAIPGEEPVAIYNSTELFEEHTLHSLVPGTTYLFQIAACTAGGCALSPPSVAHTEESSPEEVPPPTVQYISPHTLRVSWDAPRKPNGVISSYGLWMDGVMVQNSSATSFVVGGLSPWSPHSFIVQACTAQGCALGPLVRTEVWTSETPPLGSIPLAVVIETPRSVRVKWDPPAKPNGNLTYTVLITGAFSGDCGPRLALLNIDQSGRWLSVGGLLPYSNYSVQVQACNSQGCVESTPASVSLPPAGPDGLSAPRLAAITSSSLQVAWFPPARPNAPGPLRYQLQMRKPATQHIWQLLDNETSVFSHLVEGLEPYTEYQFRLLVSHSDGEANSSWVSFSTAQDRPGPVDPPMLFEIHSRNATVSWSPPSHPNGILTNYNIYQNGELGASVPATSTSLIVSGLGPYQKYTFQVEACTEAGCTASAESHTVQTAPAPPEGVVAPRLYSDTPTSVLVAWTPPLHANGELESYTVERRPNGTQQTSIVATVLPNRTLTYLDGSVALSPWTSYEYRVVANTRQGGSNGSQWERVTTRPSRPARLLPPEVLVLGPESVQVTWAPPLVANGEIEGYEIRMPAPRLSHTNTSLLNRTVTGLVPYTNYSVTVLACSGGGGYVGGCTESPPTSVTTLPTIPQGVASLSVVPISESFLAVSWQPPARPNGPNLRYELLRRKTRQPLARRPPEDFNRWHHVYAGGKLLHEDKGLSRYTWYEYKLLVHNDVGYASGEVTAGITKAGLPLTPPNVSTVTLNHTAILVNWTTPTLQDLQGKVELYFLTVNSTQESQTLSLDPSMTSAVISDLQPNTEYTLSLTVSNGAHNISSPEVMCTTLHGEPDGVFPPEVVILNSTSARVLWAAPLFPNGAVMRYSVYLDGQFYTSTGNTSGSLLLGGLLPFTIYDVQVEVCTVYACVLSNGTKVTTVESTPAELTAPHIQVLSSSSVRLEWTSPGRPNGILGGYDIYRRALKSCEELQTKQALLTQTHCTYLQCAAHQDFCGNSCYDPEQQVCCGGTAHNLRELHGCCGEQYLLVANASVSVCCGGQLLHPLPLHQCCGEYYVAISPGEVCCPDRGQRRVSVGPGDSCCGTWPFSSSTGQVCCSGSLHDGFSSQCCGGQLVSRDAVCCGDAGRGTAYSPTPGMACCGEQYINTSFSLCCGGPGPEARAHVLGDSGEALTCCRSKLIPLGQQCCNGVGFSPHTATCADRAPRGLLIPEKCRPSALCPVDASLRAYCGLCDFDPTLFTCTWVLSEQGKPPATPTPSASPQRETERKFYHLFHADVFLYTDPDLEPFTHYEYRIRAWSRHGHVFSPSSWITTKEAKPQGVSPPNWSRVGVRDDIIQLDWSPPFKPNEYILFWNIDGQERYRGAERSFTDAGGIQPFQEYTYQLRACTVAGCSDSPKVVAVTVQGIPEGVAVPVVSALGPTALHVSWVAPAKANGVVREYRLIQSGAGVIHTDTQGEMAHTVTGLQPHTNYSFLLTACTAAGCRAGQPSTGRTLQDAPAGVWAVPRHVLLNSTAVELFWTTPSKPHGLLARYRLLRDGQLIFAGGPDATVSYLLIVSCRYVYKLEASTGGGSSLSSPYVIRTPVSSPEGIPAPHNISVVGPRSVFVVWSPPGSLAADGRGLPVEYDVLLNAGTERPLVRRAGQDRFLVLDGLDPYTSYDIRVQACQAGNSPGVSVQTPEAVPQALDPPVLRAAAATVVEVHWSPPHKPNGLLTTYLIYRRPKGTQEELLVFIWTEGPLEFIDASDSLQPFTEYEYRVTAHNSQGSASSSWSSTLTLEAEPEGMAPPTAWPTGPYSVLLNWTQPSKPNGQISKYRVVYQKESRDPTLNSTMVTALTVPGDVHQAHVFGLEPYTSYSVRVEAVNKGGSAAGPWATLRTLQASPSGLGIFSVEKCEHGRALLLQWLEPTLPNGVLKMYSVFSDGNLEFSGLSRQFLFRRLAPYTTYALVLEACTEVGCTRTPIQPVTTGEAPPASQAPPSARRIGPRDAELSWNPPGQPNGIILLYQLMAAGVEDGGFRSDEDSEDDETQAKVACTVRDVDTGSFSCNVSGLQPWSSYRFRVRVSNTAGSTNSPWLTIRTKQAPPRSLAPPAVSHLEGRPQELFVSWAPPLEANGVILSYRIQRGNVGFRFSFDSSVLNYTDQDLTAHTIYSYAVIACTIAGCVTSQPTVVRTLEAAPATVKPPIVSNVMPHSLNASWTAPTIQNGEILEYILQINKEEVYHGKKLGAQVRGLEPHTSYFLILTACTNGGCTTSAPTPVQTREASPTGMPAPTLKVTGPESVEVAWEEPDCPNGVITGYELHRDGHVIYAGMDTHFHDFTLLPNVEYSYTVTASNSQGMAISPSAVARTQSSAPSGMLPPRLQALGPSSIMVQWEPPVRANGILISYSVYERDPSAPNVRRLVFAAHHSAFQSRSFSLTALQPYCRYEVRVEACTLLGCTLSEWASVQTPEAPPAGQSPPLLELQADSKGMQTVFLLSWSPPAHTNGKLLHYELYRRLSEDAESQSAASLVYRDVSTSYHDRGLLPYTPYEYQVIYFSFALSFFNFTFIISKQAVLLALTQGHLHHLSPCAQLSEGTSQQQTLHHLAPFTAYTVGVEVCTCPGCCSRGPLSELRTPPSAPAQQPPPRPIALASRWALAEWDRPLQPNGIIESFELLVRSACPQPMQPVPMGCSVGQVESRFFRKGQSLNITTLLPYATYDICVVSYNNMGSTASEWVPITTLKEPPQYKQAFVVHSNLTAVCVDWGLSFFLNGPLREYSLSESGLRVYSGFHSSANIPRTSDKTFVFQVTCTTDSGSASSPIIKYSTTTGIGTLSSAGKGGAFGTVVAFYTELWFILLMALLGLVLLALLLGVLLRRALSKAPFVRERAPLQPLQRRSPTYPPNGLNDTKVGGSTSQPRNPSHQASMSVLHVTSENQLSHAYSQNSLHRSISQLIDTQDRKSWKQELQGTDSGMFVGGEEFRGTINGFSSMKKEETIFTDTHL